MKNALTFYLLLLCVNAKGDRCDKAGNCPDGSACRKDKHCLSGSCVSRICASSSTSSSTSTAATTETSSPSPTAQSKQFWSISNNLQSIQDFGFIEKDAFGSSNRQFVNDPAGGSNTVLRVEYPKGSYKPSSKPVGGTGFYAQPINLKNATFVSLSYKVFFPANFDFVKGGKLPGLYGGRATCSGGDAALDCFSTRYMFRANGVGELYAYVDNSKQLASFCQIPPLTICSPTYGNSLGRGAFSFKTGEWTHLTQNITLNTPGKPDGKVAIYANGKLVINYEQIQWRRDSSISFVGIDFATFFGGSLSSWATPITQFTFFKDFSITAY